MTRRYLSELVTPDVIAAEQRQYGRSHSPEPGAAPDPLGPDEQAFIASRDSFYLSTVSTSGWPYLQHRGGPPGFLVALDPSTLGFANLRGNRQLISTGNVTGNDRVALMLMDYPNRRRLKVLGHARVLAAAADPALADRLSPAPDLRRRIETLFLIDVVAFDWNCPAYITPRYTATELAALAAT